MSTFPSLRSMADRWLRRVAWGVMALGLAVPASAGVAYTGSTTVLQTPGFTLNQPCGLALSLDKTLYLVDGGNGRVLKAASDGTVSLMDIGSLTLTQPSAVAVDGSGTVYIGDNPVSGSRVIRVPQGGTATVLDPPTGGFPGPIASLTVTPLQSLLVGTDLSASGACVFQYASSSGWSTFFADASGLGCWPEGLAADRAGNVYIGDAKNNRILLVASGGTPRTVAITGLDPVGYAPCGLAVDAGGQMFMADPGNGRVVAVAPGGAGSVLNLNACVYSGASKPNALALDPTGALYLADPGGNQVLVIMPGSVDLGQVAVGATTAASRTLNFTVDAGTTIGSVQMLNKGAASGAFSLSSATATLGLPYVTGSAFTVTVAFQPTLPGPASGAIVVRDGATPSNVLATVPLSGLGMGPQVAFEPGALEVTAAIGITGPFQIAFDGSGLGYVASLGDSKVYTFPAGGGALTPVSTGALSLSEATGVAVDGAGNLFISDYHNNRIVKVASDGTASILAISGLSPAINQPATLAMDSNGDLLMVDWGNTRLVRVTPAGVGSVVPTPGHSFQQGGLTGLAVDHEGNLFAADRNANQIVQITPQGTVSILPLGNWGLSGPQGVASDGKGTIYVADSGHSRVLRLTATGAVSTVKIPGAQFLGAGVFGLTPDPSGNLYIADWMNHRILMVPSATPPTLTFPWTSVGVASTPQAIQVMNLGNSPLSFKEAANFPAGFPDGGATTVTASLALAPGASAEVSCEFIPQASGPQSGTIVLTDDHLNATGPAWATQAIPVTGSGELISLQPGTLSDPLVYQPYSQTLTASGGFPPYTFTLSQGNLPTGMTLAPNGQLTGTPTASGGFTFTLAATDLASCSGSQSYTVTVGKATTTTALTSSLNPSDFGQPVTFTATVTASSVVNSGTVTFMDGSASLGTDAVTNGQASFQTTTFSAGNHAITAVYGGDGNDNPSNSAAVTQVVTKALATVTLGNLTQAYTGSPRVATATTAPASLTVTLAYNGSPTAPTAPGSYAVVATVQDANYQGSAQGTLIIQKEGLATFTLACSGNAYSGEAVTLTAQATALHAVPTGQVSFLDGTTALGTAPFQNGVAVFATTSLTVGTHTLTACYQGDAICLGGTANAVTATIAQPILSLETLPATLTLSADGSGTSQISLMAMGIPSGPVTLSASGLPGGLEAQFTQATVDGASLPTTVQVRVRRSSLKIAGLNSTGSWDGRAGVFLFGGILALPFAARRGNRRRGGVALLALAVLGGILCCGGKSQGLTNIVPPGTYAVTLRAQAAGAATATTSLTVIVP